MTHRKARIPEVPTVTADDPRGQGRPDIVSSPRTGYPPEALALLNEGPPLYVADLDGDLLFANRRYRELARSMGSSAGNPGVMPEPMFALGEVIARVIAEDRAHTRQDVIEGGREVRYFHSTHYPIRDGKGRLTAVGGIYDDTTAEVASLAGTLTAKERFDDISRLVSDWIWETDADFNLTYVSPRVTEVLDLHPREMLGQNLFSLGTFTGPAGPCAPRDRAPSPRSRSPFRNLPFEVTLRDGRVKLFRLSGLPMFSEDGGRFAGFRGTATDVSAETEARRMESVSRGRLTTAIENISDGFALFDAAGRLVVYNNRFRDYLSPIERILVPGAPFGGILQAAEEAGVVTGPPGVLEEWFAARSGAAARAESSFEIHLADGRWLRVSDGPAADGGIVSLLSDVTEMIEREDSLREAKEQAEQASRSKTEFLANMSHELRTPLNAIIGFSEVMRDETFGALGSPRYREYIADIIDSSRHLLGVINDILEVSKSEAGRLEINEDEVDLRAEIEAAARLFIGQAADAGVALAADLPPDLPRLRADRRKIRQMLLNLISNAVKFTPAGGHVRVFTERGGDGGLAIMVEDTGIGIRAEDMKAALAPFGQVESTLSRRYAGTGLGLPLTRALAECHGGRLELDSEPGRGTRVTIRLPARRVVG